jgi:hypothetical protein
MATTSSYDPDLDALISRLAGPLLPVDRAAFRAAAESALTGCSGEGLAYRILRDVWRGYFHPPPDERLAHSGARHRGGKLVNGPAIGADTVSGLKSARSRWERAPRGLSTA